MRDVIFAIDDCNYQHRASFEAWLLDNGGKKLIGKYTHTNGEAVKEVSYLIGEELFDVVKSQGYVDNQESILFVTRCNKQYASLFYPATKTAVALGSMVHVPWEEAERESAWTFDPMHERYFICKAGNPDRESPEARKQRKLFGAIEAVLNQYESGQGAKGRLEVMRDLRKQFNEQKPKWID